MLSETVPAGEGLIRTMGFADFNCTNGDLCSIAHSAADTGGEFAAGAALDISWYPEVRTNIMIMNDCLYGWLYLLMDGC